ncbi:MAG: Holliday junction resolvase RuvX [Bacteroidota bacterium]
MTTHERFLGLDYGSTRIGVALSDPLGIIAKGLSVVINNARSISVLEEYIKKYAISKVVVGMPINLKGEKGQKALEVEEFIGQLIGKTGVEVIRWDERFSSQSAHRTLIEMGVKKMKRREKGQIDQMAAAIILQSFLDSRSKT